MNMLSKENDWPPKIVFCEAFLDIDPNTDMFNEAVKSLMTTMKKGIKEILEKNKLDLEWYTPIKSRLEWDLTRPRIWAGTYLKKSLSGAR